MNEGERDKHGYENSYRGFNRVGHINLKATGALRSIYRVEFIDQGVAFYPFSILLCTSYLPYILFLSSLTLCLSLSHILLPPELYLSILTCTGAWATSVIGLILKHGENIDVIWTLGSNNKAKKERKKAVNHSTH